VKRSRLIAVGATVLLAIAVVIKALFLLHPTPGDGKNKLHVRFQNIDKISHGTRVTFAGKPVGEVESVTLLDEAFDRRSLEGKPIYPYELVLAIDSSVKVYHCDAIGVKTAGLMGEKCVAITPQPADQVAELEPVSSDEILFASQPGTVEETFSGLSSVAGKAEESIEALEHFLKNNDPRLSKALDSFSNASQELETLLATLNKTGVATKLSRLEQKTNTCVDNLNTLIKTMNEYGLFFHSNRTWQRERLQNKDQRDSIQECPEEFKRRLYQLRTQIEQLQKELETTEHKRKEQ